MKTRCGFVSNSSSSSFIVPYRSGSYWMPNKQKILLSPAEINKLRKYGFEWVDSDNPFEVFFRGIDGCYTPAWTQRQALAFYIDCNQEWVAYFLVREMNVSFKAAIHYANWFWHYKKGNKNIQCVHNLGLTEEMYGRDNDPSMPEKNRYNIRIANLHSEQEDMENENED